MSCGELLIVANPADVHEDRIVGRLEAHLFVCAKSIIQFFSETGKRVLVHVVEGHPTILIRPTLIDGSCPLIEHIGGGSVTVRDWRAVMPVFVAL